MATIKDKEYKLLNKITSGDTAAMREFYNGYAGYLTAVCSRYIINRDDVKDILQECFIKIFKSIGSFEYKGPGSVKAWTTRIVVNESLKFIQRNQRLEVCCSWDLPDVEEDQDPDFDHVPMAVVLEMIRMLPQGYRMVFNLYVFEEKSHREIAEILNIAENTSASQLHRAKNFLVKKINEYRNTSNKKWSYEQALVK